MKTQDPVQLCDERHRRNRCRCATTEALAKGDKAAKSAAAERQASRRSIPTRTSTPRQLELDLQRSLGLDVDIHHTNGKGGEVRIKYAQLEQLDEICRSAVAAAHHWSMPRSETSLSDLGGHVKHLRGGEQSPPFRFSRRTYPVIPGVGRCGG